MKDHLLSYDDIYDELGDVRSQWSDGRKSVEYPKQRVMSTNGTIRGRPSPDHGPPRRRGIEEPEEGRSIALLPATRVKPEHTRWLWEGRIPLRGMTLTVGMEGRGKTTMVVQIVAELTRGALAGDLHTQPVSVVYVTAEDSLSATVVPRLMAAGADLRRVHFVTIDGVGGAGLTLPGDLPALAAAMSKAEARLLVIDPVVAHLHGALDSHKDQQVRHALAPLARWADDANGAVLGVMHLNKSLGADVLNRVNGSRGFTAAARSVLTVGDDPRSSQHRVVAVGKANLAPADVPTLRFRIEGRTVPHPDGDEPIATSGIVWLGEATGVTSRDLLAASMEEDRSAREEAAEWLSDLLGAGAVASEEVKRKSQKAGLSFATVRRAKVDLGVQSKHWGRPGEEGGWCWGLPGSGSQGAQENPKVLTPRPEHLQHLVSIFGTVHPFCEADMNSYEINTSAAASVVRGQLKEETLGRHVLVRTVTRPLVPGGRSA